MGRAEAQAACQFSGAVLTFASLLPNAKMGRSVTYCALLGSSGKQWESANPRYRIFAPSFSKAESNGNYCTLLQETERNVKVRFPRIVSLHSHSKLYYIGSAASRPKSPRVFFDVWNSPVEKQALTIFPPVQDVIHRTGTLVRA